jgi:ATP-dependent DNA helicase MPH1
MDSSPPQSLGISGEMKAKKVEIPLSPVSKTSLARTQAFESTQPVRRPVQRPIRRNISVISSSDAEMEMPPPGQRRLRRLPDSSPAPEEPKRKEKKREPLTKRKRNPLLDYTAEHSGDDASSGLSDSDDDVESESDRLFIKNSPMTQISPSYNQTLVYRKGLMTQAPVDGPDFLRGPVRNKPFGRMEPRKRRRVVDSSPPPEDDEYEFGSFVVDNDAEISYLTQADELP